MTRVARTALPGGPAHWRSGARLHLPLRTAEPDQVHGSGGRAHLARRMAGALADRPDVLLAYWDEGLARLVVTMTEGAVVDRVVDHAAELAVRDGLLVAGGDPEEHVHPADPAGVRAAATTLGVDLLGIAGALTGYALRLPPTPRAVTALVTLLRENPRVRALLRARIGAARMDLLLATANAIVHAGGQTPTSLVLDGTLRSLQLTETMARAAAFDSLHDELCGPERVSVAPADTSRPPLRESPAQVYAAHASAGSVLGAVAALLVKRNLNSAAEAALSGSPKAARYAPAAFHAVLGTALARADVLVRDPERLRQLEMAGTLLLHPSALRTDEGLPDPWTEAVLDAARRARLRVVLVDDPALEDFTGLADQVVDARRPLDDVVHALRGELDARAEDDDEEADERVVITVARPRAAEESDVLAGLDAADIAIALTDQEGAVVWGADILAPHGLPDVWRLLTAIPAARTVGSRGQILARSGAALSGLLVAIGEARRGRGRRSVLPGLRHAPVDTGALTALAYGVWAALGVAAARAPHPHARVRWHELDPDEAVERLDREAPPNPAPWYGPPPGSVRPPGGSPAFPPSPRPASPGSSARPYAVNWTTRSPRCWRSARPPPRSSARSWTPCSSSAPST